MASSRLEDTSWRVSQPLRTFEKSSQKFQRIMANGKEQSSCNVETFSAEIFGGEIFGGANGSFGREKRGVVVRCAAGGRRGCCMLCRGRPAVSTPHMVRVVGGGVGYTPVRLSLCLRGSTQNVAYTLRS